MGSSYNLLNLLITLFIIPYFPYPGSLVHKEVFAFWHSFTEELGAMVKCTYVFFASGSTTSTISFSWCPEQPEVKGTSKQDVLSHPDEGVNSKHCRWSDTFLAE